MYNYSTKPTKRLTNVPPVMSLFCVFVCQYNHWCFMYKAYTKDLQMCRQRVTIQPKDHALACRLRDERS